MAKKDSVAQVTFNWQRKNKAYIDEMYSFCCRLGGSQIVNIETGKVGRINGVGFVDGNLCLYRSYK